MPITLILRLIGLILPPGFDFDLDLAIVGVYGEFGKFFARYEYDNKDKDFFLIPLEGHSYGYQIGYNFSNKITAYYEYSTFCNIDVEKALYLKVKFK